MVVISEVEGTFWGLCLETGKRYSQNVETSFHVSMAAIDPHSSKENGPVTVYLEKNKVAYVLCSLDPGSCNQQQLDLNFQMGEDIILFVKEKGTVHLTGYLIDEDDLMPEYSDDEEEGEEEDLDEDEDEDDEEEEEITLVGRKRKLNQLAPGKKKLKLEVSDDEEEEETEVLEKEKPKKKKDKMKKENGEKKEAAAETPVMETEDKKKKKKKKNKNKNKEGESTPKQETQTKSPVDKPKKRTTEGGVTIEDIKEGHGPEAVNGKQLRLYYTGKLQNGKVFDSQVSGNPFNFRMGKKEVIPGWEVGLKGMKVGGKRKLTIPPKMGYGPKAAGKIPPNSTLTFEVELKAVN